MTADKLDQAIETLYRVFARYEVPTHLVAPAHREPETLVRELTSVPLRELSGRPIRVYAFWATTTVGNADDYRHFLPRILELAALNSPKQSQVEPWIIASRLDHARWRTWPEVEQAAIEALFFVAWEHTVGDYREDALWFVGIAAAQLDLDRALAIWQRDTSLNAALKCAWFLSEEVILQDGNVTLKIEDTIRLVDDVYGGPESRRKIAAWLLSPLVKQRLEAALGAAASVQYAPEGLKRGIEAWVRLSTDRTT